MAKPKEDFRITGSTIQVEVEGCEPNEMYYTLQRFDPERGCSELEGE